MCVMIPGNFPPRYQLNRTLRGPQSETGRFALSGSMTRIYDVISPGVDSDSNRSEYQEYFLEGEGGRCVGLTTLPPSCADCLEI